MPDFTIITQFDEASLRTVARFAEFQGFYEMRRYDAGQASLEALQREAVEYMDARFMNPTGQLADSLEAQMLTPYEGQLGTNMPYARRREWGFSGMTDALGRYYPNDPGIGYMEAAIRLAAPDITKYYETAVKQTVADLGGTP